MLYNSRISSLQEVWPGGIGVFSAWGTFGGATVSLQYTVPDGTLLTAGVNTTLTATGNGSFYLPRCNLQATITNASGSTSISTAVGPVQEAGK